MITNLSIGHYGRFGNQLFQIAAVIGLAGKWGQDYKFLPWINADHKEKFNSKEDVDLAKHFVNELPTMSADEHEVFRHHHDELPVPWGYHDLPACVTGNWNITGHFQSEKYFKNRMDEVRQAFRMKNESGDYSNMVAIHVRLGDYDNHYHTRLDELYYLKAIEQFPKGTTFILFSDQPELAAPMFQGQCKFVVREGDTYINDFALMKSCRSFICGNSSYSLMAAILGDYSGKKIVCPSKWFGPAWTPETKDLYPEGAIIV